MGRHDADNAYVLVPPEPEGSSSRSNIRPRVREPRDEDDECSPDELPDVLRPPWLERTTATKPRRSRLPAALDPKESHCELHWREPEPFVAPWSDWHFPNRAPTVPNVLSPRDDVSCADAEEERADADPAGRPRHAVRPDLDQASTIAYWATLAEADDAPPPLAPLRALGLLDRKALPVLFAIAHRWLSPEATVDGVPPADLLRLRRGILTALTRVESPEVARLMARALGCGPSMQLPVAAWLRRHPEAAATGLIPAAHANRADAAPAERALRLLAQQCGHDVCATSARRQGAAVAKHWAGRAARRQEDALHLPYVSSFLRRLDVSAFVATSSGAVVFANREATSSFHTNPSAVRKTISDAIRDRHRPDEQLVLPLDGRNGGDLYLVLDRADHNGLEVRLESSRWSWGLTDRQCEVLRWLALGYGNKEIAERLRCAEVTVELHVTPLLRKAEVDSRAKLVARFWRHI